MFQRGILNCRNVLNGIGVKSFKNGSNSILINNKLGIQGRSAFSTTQQQQSINNSNSINSISNKVNSEESVSKRVKKLTKNGNHTNVLKSLYPFDSGWFWHRRYSLQQEPFDWYLNYSSDKEWRDLVKRLKSEDKILILGAGKSPLPFQMFQDGFKNIHVVDFAASVAPQQTLSEHQQLEQQQQEPLVGSELQPPEPEEEKEANIDDDHESSELVGKNENQTPEKTPFPWSLMDVRELDFENESFDAVIDQGCLDCILTGDGNVLAEFELGVSEISRILKRQGLFMMLSCGSPKYRVPLLDQWEYGIVVNEVTPINSVNVYSMIKQRQTLPLLPPPDINQQQQIEHQQLQDQQDPPVAN